MILGSISSERKATDNRMRKGYFAAGIACLVACAFCIVKSLPAPAPRSPALVQEATEAIAEQSVTLLHGEGEDLIPDEYVSPIDFDALMEMNEDIYAWLYIPGTDINHPVLQSVRGDNDYYLNHSADHQSDENGCLFTEYLYNDTMFADPVTVIYGHRMRSGQMFGQLEKLYASWESLNNLDEIIVYTPTRELHYQVFAATPFSNLHILNYYRRFVDARDIPAFAERVAEVHSFARLYDDSTEVTEDDHLLVLSTCLIEDETQRFIVVAKLMREIS